MPASWGYEDEQPDTVNMRIPADLADAVASFVQDPDQFVAGIQASGEDSVMLIKVRDTWVNPKHLVVVRPQAGGSDVRFVHGIQVHIGVAPDDLVDLVREAILSDPRSSL